MGTISNKTFEINGVIDTNQTVLQNLNTLCTASGCWITFDANSGKWSVIINKPGTSIKSFNDSNIIGNINISGTGISELYNAVSVEFPHKDLRDQTDYVELEIPVENRFPNELDNTLNISMQCINNPIQAQYIGVVELKQSRVDKVIEFRTDYTALGLKAGDLIDITSEMYGFTNKVFRITKMTEEDADDGSIQIQITALEYDEGIYNTSGLEYLERNKKTGIIPKSQNTALTESDFNASNRNFMLEVTQNAREHGLVISSQTTPTNTIWKLGYNEYTQSQINASGVVISWAFNSGTDLDIRCRMYSPNLGQNTIDDYLGYTGDESTGTWEISGVPVLIWGGDNTGVGVETVYVNLQKLREVYPSQQKFIVECRGNWYGTKGANPYLSAYVYNGGTVQQDGFNLYVAGSLEKSLIQGLTVTVNSNETDEAGETTLGDLMGYYVFETDTYKSYFTTTLPT